MGLVAFAAFGKMVEMREELDRTSEELSSDEL